MKLPHQEPILFAKELIEKKENEIEVLCSFPKTPTLAMFMEAAAQSSAGFNEEKNIKVGLLSMAKNIRLLEAINEKEYVFKLKKEAEMNNYKQYAFEASTQSQVLTVSGSFTLVLEE